MRRRLDQEASMPLLEHLKALRKVVLISAYAIAIGALVGWVVSDPVFAYLAKPILDIMEDIFITTTPLEPVLVKLKMSLVIGAVIASPIIFWQLWSFILPALKRTERKWLYISVPCSILLFLGGVAFCFYYVLPIGVKFLLFVGGNAVVTTTFLTKASFLNFILAFLLMFGLVFQIPIVLLILISLRIIAPQTLAKKRRYALFFIVLIAVIISPTPDLLSQGLMIFPMYLLYEISIWLGYLIVWRWNRKANAQ